MISPKASSAIMNALLRLVLFVCLVFAGQSYATTAMFYGYEADTFQAGVENLNNNGLTNPSGCCSNLSSRDSQDRAQARAFFALGDGFVVPKGLEGVLDTNAIKFTQDTLGRNINGITSFKDGRAVQGLIDKFKAAGKYTDDVAPIRVFEKDGVIYTLDNRRLFAAHQAGVKVRTVPATAEEIARESFKFTNPGDGTFIGIKVEANVRNYDDPISPEQAKRFIFEGKTPTTWGEAIELRVQKQSTIQGVDPTWSERFPNGSIYDPDITGEL